MSKNIRTLGDMKNDNNGPDSAEESDGTNDRQEFYVGGSEHSGQQVVGPEQGRRDLRAQVFAAARRAGAVEYREDDQQTNASSSFGGGGMRLGRSDSDHQSVAPAVPADQPSAQAGHRVTVYVWQNGFSIDDGPLRNPSNGGADAEFMSDVMRGNIPRELAVAYPGEELKVRLEPKDGPYVAPPAKPFKGSGARLGGIVPNVVSTDVPAVPQPSQQESTDNIAKAQEEVKLDSSGPVTQLQIRLQDGKRLVGKFNHGHTISAVRNFIVSARPDLAFAEFQLMTTYPNKIIDDETVSLADAGLLNAVIALKAIV